MRTFHRPIRLVAMLVGLMVIPQITRAADADKPDAPGLILVIENAKSASPKPAFPDARVSRTVALYVPADTAPSDFTPPEAFRATFTGDLNLRLRSFVRFSAEGRGKLTLTLNGAPALEASGDDLS